MGTKRLGMAFLASFLLLSVACAAPAPPPTSTPVPTPTLPPIPIPTEAGYVEWCRNQALTLEATSARLSDLLRSPASSSATWRQEVARQAVVLTQLNIEAQRIVTPPRFTESHRTYQEAMREFGAAGRLSTDAVDKWEQASLTTALINEATQRVANGNGLLIVSRLKVCSP